MTKNKILDATNELVQVLQSLGAEDRARVIDAALMVLGDGPHLSRRDNLRELTNNDGGGRSVGQTAERSPGGKLTPKSYVDGKQPDNKVEELAVAARYRELYENADASTRDELAEVLGQKGARRNFDRRNFRRDVDNARKAGLFTKGSERGSVVLSHHGQTYVDTLPDREALKKLKKPKGAGRRKSSRKQATKRAVGR